MTMTQPPPTPPPIAHLASPAVTAPSPQHIEQIAAARKRGKAIKRCASTASFSAWTMAIFGACTLLGSIGSWFGMALGAGMCVLSHFEFKGAREMRRLDINAPNRLARNQVILMAALLIYSVAALWSALSGPSELDRALGNEAELKGMFGSVTEIERSVSIILYTVVGAAAILGCGGAALYYKSRRKYIEAYLRETPPWITQLEQAGMSVY
jgi:hypothetical protein